jgi:DNA-binding transcriptional LysR family regulator
MRFEIIPTATPHEALLDRADVAMILDRDVPPGPWHVRILRHVREWLLASPAYLDHHGRPERPEDLHDHALLYWVSPEGGPPQLPLANGGTMAIEPLLATTQIHILRRCAISGLGIAYLPDAGLMLPSEPPGTLVSVLPEQVGAQRPLRLLVPSALRQTPRTNTIIEATEMIISMHEHLATPVGEAPPAHPRTRDTAARPTTRRRDEMS